MKYIQMLQEKDASATAQKWAEQFAKTTVCPECKGAVSYTHLDVYKRQA